MKPRQCGTGHDSDSMHPLDRAAIVWARQFLRDSRAVSEHRSALARIAERTGPKQIRSAAPYKAGDFVRVATAEHAGRWGQVVTVDDYRDRPYDQMHDGEPFLIHVDLMTSFRKQLVPLYPLPVPFDPTELGPLFDNLTECVGVYVKSGRVVSRRNWPRARPEAIA